MVGDPFVFLQPTENNELTILNSNRRIGFTFTNDWGCIHLSGSRVINRFDCIDSLFNCHCNRTIRTNEWSDCEFYADIAILNLIPSARVIVDTCIA